LSGPGPSKVSISIPSILLDSISGPSKVSISIPSILLDSISISGPSKSPSPSLQYS
ncbi:hypothetical protein J4Q44_G00373650, partial [Coregonus suidteri]